MKIVFCMHHMVMGGVEKVLCQYLTELAKYDNVAVTVICQRKIDDLYFIDFFNKKHIHYVDGIFMKKRRFFLFDWYRKIYNKFMKRRVQKILNQFDVVLDFCNCCCASELKKVTKIKIGWCHGSILFLEQNVKNFRLNEYDKVVCLTDSCRKDFAKDYPEYQDKMMCLYNPIDVSHARQSAEENNNIFDMTVPYFIAVQRLDVDKDVETIIRAFQIFSEKNTKVRLYIVGNGSEYSKLKGLAASNPYIIFTGQVNHVYGGIKNAQALILSSDTKIGEGFGQVLLEAQAVGTLAISSDVKSGPAEILMNGKAGVLFEPHNYQQLAQIMEDVIQHKEKYQSRIECATQNLSRFDAKLIVQDLLNQIELLKREKEQVF